MRGIPVLWLVITSSMGCGATSWAPAPPAGVTYRYDYQGFVESSVTVTSGRSYFGVFGFRDEVDAHADGEMAKDPFEEAKPIDGIRFNTHLGTQGERVTP